MFLKRIFINTVSLFDYNKLWFYYSFYLEENDGVAVFPEDVSRLSSSSRLAKAGLGSSSRLVKAISGPSSRLAKAISGPSSRREGGPWVELTSCEDGRLSSSLSQVVAPTSRAGPNLSNSPQSQDFPQIKTKVSPQIWLLDYIGPFWLLILVFRPVYSSVMDSSEKEGKVQLRPRVQTPIYKFASHFSLKSAIKSPYVVSESIFKWLTQKSRTNIKITGARSWWMKGQKTNPVKMAS